MYESSVIRHYTEQGIKQGIEIGIEQGERKEALESLIDILEFHFSTDEVQPIIPILESIDELQQLKQLRRLALQVLTNLDISCHQ